MQAVQIELNNAAKVLAHAEYVRLELMINRAMWDKELSDEEKPVILKYLNRQKANTGLLVDKGVLL